MPVGLTAVSVLRVRLEAIPGISPDRKIRNIGDWCNGNTADSKPAATSSILVSPVVEVRVRDTSLNEQKATLLVYLHIMPSPVSKLAGALAPGFGSVEGLNPSRRSTDD